MFINHTKKYLYLRIPKTGSTSFETQLVKDVDVNDDVSYAHIPFTNIPNKNWDYSEQEYKFMFRVNNPHLTYFEITQLLTVDISNYDMYGTLRNPIDKFLSSAYHMEYYGSSDVISARKIPIPVTLSNNELVEYWLNKISINPDILKVVIFKPQSEWLINNGQLINNIFLYENLPNMMQKITGNPNSVLRFDYRSEARPNKSYTDLDNSLQQQIISVYSDDNNLYNSIVNKTI
jgi:hypothetical protein